MKIIRYIDSLGNSGYASQQPDGTVLAIEGDLLGEYQVTDRKVKVAKLLAPIQPTAILCIGLNYKQKIEGRLNR